MISNAVKERLLQKNWAVKCTTEQELSLVLQACDDAGIKWLSGERATEWDFDGSYPLYIDFCNAIDGITGNLTGSYTGNCTDITDWFFNAIKNNDDNGKLTPQNAEQEHWVKIILARLQGIPIEVYSIINNKWTDLGDDCSIFMGYEYRIKSKPTPLPISRDLWSHIDKRWRFIAIDRSGTMYLVLDKPTARDGLWLPVGGVYSHCPLNINTDGIYWETSLTERPEDV